MICIVSQKKTCGSQTSERSCWDRWDSAHPWAHLLACHMPGSVLSLVSPRDDFISLKHNWRNRSRNWQLLRYAHYYFGGKLQIPWGTHRNFVGTQIGPSRVREGFLQLIKQLNERGMGTLSSEGTAHAKVQRCLSYYFQLFGKKCAFSCTNRNSEWAGKLAHTSQPIQIQTKQPSFPMLWCKIDNMILLFHSVVVFGLNQCSKVA